MVGASVQGYLWYYEEQQFMPLINNYRASIGKPALATSECLSQAARAWSQQMASADNLYHSPGGYADSYCGSSIGVGENAYYTTDWSGASAQTAFNSWYNSALHRANMGGDYDHTGLGFYWDETHGKLWATEEFYNCSPLACPGSVATPASYPTTPDASTCREIDVPGSVTAGQSFTGLATWDNTGNSTWFSSFRVVSDNSYWGKTQDSFASFDASEHINPGRAAGFTNTFTAPSTPGSYAFSWHIKNAGGAVFGDNCSKTITVSAVPAAPSSSATPSSTSKSSTAKAADTSPAAPAASEGSDATDSEAAQASSSAKPPSTSVPSTNKNSSKRAAPQPSLLQHIQLVSSPVKIGVSVVSIVVIALIVVFHARLHLSFPSRKKNTAR